jgi:hypothetical protein
MSTRRLLLAAALACGACGHTFAADFPVNHALPDARLDIIRGGFDVGDLRASLGVERTVLVNGVEAIRQSVTIPDIAKMTTDQAMALRSVLSTTVVNTATSGASSDAVAATTATQVAAAVTGSLPTTAAASTPAATPAAVPAVAGQTVAIPTTLASATMPIGTNAGLIVQNALNNQAISATTKIDASVNTSQMLQTMRIDEAIRDATIQFRGN